VQACYSSWYAPEPTTIMSTSAGGVAESSGGAPPAGAEAAAALQTLSGALCGLRLAGTSSVLVFEQLPWHSVAARLRRENSELREEQRTVRLELEEHQAELLRVEEQLLLFQKAMDTAEEGGVALRNANAVLAASEAKAIAEAASSAAEAGRLGVQVSRLQDKLAELRESVASLTVSVPPYIPVNLRSFLLQSADHPRTFDRSNMSSQEAGAAHAEVWEQKLEVIKKVLHAAELERQAAVDMAASRVAPEEVAQLQASLEVRRMQGYEGWGLRGRC